MENSINVKPIVILLHYFGGDKGSWQWFIKASSNKINYVAIDIAGFGENAPLKEITLENIARSIYSDILALGNKKIWIVGHSMSGKLALFLGSIDSENIINNIILLAPSPPTLEKMTENDRFKMLDQQNLQRAKDNVNDGILNSIEIEKFKYAVESQLRVDAETWKWWITKGMRNNILQEVKNITQDLHLIYSTQDKAIPVEDMESEVIQNLRFQSIYKLENTRHLIPLERPKELSEIIDKIVLG